MSTLVEPEHTMAESFTTLSEGPQRLSTEEWLAGLDVYDGLRLMQSASLQVDYNEATCKPTP